MRLCGARLAVRTPQTSAQILEGTLIATTFTGLNREAREERELEPWELRVGSWKLEVGKVELRVSSEDETGAYIPARATQDLPFCGGRRFHVITSKDRRTLAQ